MKRYYSTIAVFAYLLSAGAAFAEDRASPGSSSETAVLAAAQAETAIDHAAKANKYVFLFFWKENSSQTNRVWETLKPTIAKLSNEANFVSIRVTNPAEKKTVDKYGVSRAPLPLVLAIAPNGAVTKAFTKTFEEKELRTAFVSPCTQRCMKAFQDRKLVFVCLVDQAGPKEKTLTPTGVEEFNADKKYSAATEIIMLNVRDAKEAAFLKQLNCPASYAPMTIFLAPPGVEIGSFSRSTPKETIVAALSRAQSGCCSGGGCKGGSCGSQSK
jgi:hypothetical protein